MNIARITGFIVMFAGIVLKLADIPGYTIAFVVGALLILLPRLYGWFSRSASPDKN